jgi:hypothetical protein
LSTLHLQPDTWDRLKAAMRERFVPPTYQRYLRKKLQHLDKGDMSIQDYYAELQKGMIHAGVHEGTEDKICHFHEIQDIIDYREYNIVNHLFQLLCSPKKNYRVAKRQNRRPPSCLIQLLWPHPELLHLLELIPQLHLQFPVLLPRRRHLLQQHPMPQTRARLLFHREQHRTLSATIAMVLATSSETAPTRNPTLLQLMEVK